ncbi:MAG: DinB family protein [Thermoanaerobaculia bacterium]
MRSLAQSDTERFADQLERSFRGGAWHGPALGETLDGVDAATARRRPIPGSHNIFEIVSHLTFWLEETRRRIAGKQEAPSEDGWHRPDDGSDEAWSDLLADLETAHRGLHADVRALDAERLEDTVAGSDPTLRGMLLGVLQHNAYHSGQIVLLARAGAAG